MAAGVLVAHWTNDKETLKLYKQGKNYYTRYAYQPNQYADAIFIEPKPRFKDGAIRAAELRATGMRRIL